MSQPANIDPIGEENASRLKDMVREVLTEAKRLGASGAEAAVSVSQGLSATVRLGEVETVEHNRDKNLGVTVYFGQRTGSASTTDFRPAAMRETVRAACTIARYTAEDDCAGLADPTRLARNFPDLDLYHPWDLAVPKAIDLARECEDLARAVDVRITNSEGATLSSHSGIEVYGNSHDFLAAVRASRHSLSAAVIAQDKAGMQRDYWYTVSRRAPGLAPAREVGETAARRAVRRLAARQLPTSRVPVLYEAPIASSVVSHFIGAIRGSALYRQASFLCDSIGKTLFAPFVHIHEQPHLPGALGSANYDSEGVATAARDIVRDGILQGYVLDSYSARKLRMETTGNAGGVHNLTLASGALDLPGLLRQMDRGLLVTELIGFGVNTVTGDYSRGAAGFWVEGGEIQYPVEEITIAGNLRDMFRTIVAVGNDVDLRGNIRTGSLLLESMTVAGR